MEHLFFLVGWIISSISVEAIIGCVIAGIVVINWRDSLLIGIIIMLPTTIPPIIGLAYDSGITGKNNFFEGNNTYIIPLATTLIFFLFVSAVAFIKRIYLKKRVEFEADS